MRIRRSLAKRYFVDEFIRTASKLSRCALYIKDEANSARGCVVAASKFSLAILAKTFNLDAAPPQTQLGAFLSNFVTLRRFAPKYHNFLARAFAARVHLVLCFDARHRHKTSVRESVILRAFPKPFWRVFVVLR